MESNDLLKSKKTWKDYLPDWFPYYGIYDFIENHYKESKRKDPIQELEEPFHTLLYGLTWSGWHTLWIGAIGALV